MCCKSSIEGVCLDDVGNAALWQSLLYCFIVWATVTNSEFTLHALCIYISTLPIDQLLSPQGASHQQAVARRQV